LATKKSAHTLRKTVGLGDFSNVLIFESVSYRRLFCSLFLETGKKIDGLRAPDGFCA